MHRSASNSTHGSDCLDLLEQAMDIGRKELEMLEAGDVEGAEKLAGKRGSITDQALSSSESTDRDDLFDKLNQLKGLHGRITQEARQLYVKLQKDLSNVRREHRRHTAYGSARSATVSPLAQSRFVNRQG